MTAPSRGRPSRTNRRTRGEGGLSSRRTAARSTEAPIPAVAEQVQRNQAAIRLLTSWSADDSGYDEEVWPRLSRSIEANRLSSRSRLGG